MNMDNNTLAIKLNTVSMPRLLDCGILTASAPFLHVDRIADFDVMICVMQGVIYVTEDDTDYSIREKEVLFLKSGVHHFGKYEIPKGTRWFYAHFSTDPGDECCFALPKTAVVNQHYYGMLEEFCEALAKDDPAAKLRKNIWFYNILTELLLVTKNKEASLSDRISEFLYSKLDRTFTRVLVENEFYLSYSYMSSVFMKDKGMSIGSFHNSLRIKKACELLRSTDMNVGEIAAALGFDDALYFSRKFRKTTGVSPVKYRKDALEKY